MRSPSSLAYIVLLIPALCLAAGAFGQESRFRGGMLLGLNAAQIDGDDLRGFDKAGLSIGSRFQVGFTDNLTLSMDLLYSQRGAQAPYSKDNSTPVNRYSLHYLEVPFLLHYLEWAAITTADEPFHRLSFTGGLAYSRLIRARMTGNPFEGREDLLNQNDYSYVLGFGLHLNPQHSFHFRYTDSFNFLFDDVQALNTRRLRGYFLTLQYLYLF